MANFEKLGEMAFDNLVNAADLPLVVERRAMDSGVPAIKRGTALMAGTAGLKVLTGGGEPVAIAASDIEAGAKAGEVYLTGHFNRQRVDEITGITLTDTAVNALRKVGIILSWARP